MYWVIKVSYRKRNAAGEKRFLGIRVLGVMAAVCVSLVVAGMRAEPVSAAAGTETVADMKAGICRGRSADSIGSGGRYGAGSRLRRLRLFCH